LSVVVLRAIARVSSHDRRQMLAFLFKGPVQTAVTETLS
jgi:hypothetical protein